MLGAKSVAERIQEATTYKEKGNAFLKEGDLKKASLQYKQGRMFLSEIAKKHAKNTDRTMAMVNNKMSEFKPSEDEVRDGEAAFLALSLNLAQVSLKLERWDYALEVCNDALVYDENSVKALYRRGKAFLGKKDLDACKSDWERVAQLDETAITGADKKQLKQAFEGQAVKEKKVAAAMASAFSS
eukprot:NODE_5959_length_666_cov_48.964750_g5936_i0.p1 GENE.NODE_5959_length_666_cov_48.964750_g5936_i0~~NODE_5959_length_666_cov_48.964750_g5936_i0.p1  ORF type:complete len:185 (+),score=50.47 NODE_5959_length_666_cov_48.964750_g5936_i0:89-643(+)